MSTKFTLPISEIQHTLILPPFIALAILRVQGAFVEFFTADRRSSHRLQFKTALRVRLWRSCSTEQRAESENLSERGTFFTTDAPLSIGSSVEILLKMPEEITGRPATEWKCTGHVVRLEPRDSLRGKLGVGVQFDCYEILRAPPPRRESI